MRFDLLSEIFVPVRSRPLSRPRLTKGRVYQPLANQVELLGALDHCFCPITEPVIVDMDFLFTGSGKHEWPVQKNIGDEDNLRKAVCDALVKRGHLLDDRLVLGGETMKYYAPEDWTMIKIWSVR